MGKLANLSNNASLPKIFDEYGKHNETGEKSTWRKSLEWQARNECDPVMTIEVMLKTTTKDLAVYVSEHDIDLQPTLFEEKKKLVTDPPKETTAAQTFRLKEQVIKETISRAMNADDLRKIWNDNPRIQKDDWFLDEMKDRKQTLVDDGHIIIAEPEVNYNPAPDSVPF